MSTSLFRLLLCVPDLQPKLVIHLLEVLADLAVQQNRPTQRSQVQTKDAMDLQQDQKKGHHL